MSKTLWVFGLSFVFALPLSAQSKNQSCQKLETLNKSCEEMQTLSDMDGPVKLYSNMKEELSRSDKSCSEFVVAEKCAMKLGDRISSLKPARPYYKVHADVQLKNFGMDLIGSVTDTPAQKPSKSRAPANAR